MSIAFESQESELQKLRERSFIASQNGTGLGLCARRFPFHRPNLAALADGATPPVVQRQLRHSDARITQGIHGHVIGDDYQCNVV